MIASGSIFRSRPLASAVARRSALNPRSSLTPIAILIHRQAYGTDAPTSSSSSAPLPPPGFNAEQAKKPVKKTEQDVEKRSSEIDKAIKNIQAEMESATATGEPKTISTLHNGLTELAAEKAKAEAAKLVEKGPDTKKLTIWQKVKHEVQHYWDGTKLLATEVKISSRLALKMAAGYELTRRENRQLQRTVQDLGRLVPFSVFVIVPFAELLLPVALKLFPNLLPSTYEGRDAKDKKASILRVKRTEVSNFLRSTLKESGIPISVVNAQREEFTEFFRKVRATGESPTEEDVIKVCKIFKDDLTLDNLSRPQLVGMCRYMNLNTFGTDVMLRYQIRHRMRQIKRDDRAISYEGVDSLSVPELQMACASRGLRTHGVSPARLRDDLQMWLDLRLKYGVPSTLLVMSNAFMYASGKDSEMSSQIDALQGVLSSIPEELFHEIELEVHNAEGAATNKQRLEVLKEQQELIDEENEQNETNQSVDPAPKDDENIDEHEEKRAESSQDTDKEQAKEAGEAEADAAKQEQSQKADEEATPQSKKTS